MANKVSNSKKSSKGRKRQKSSGFNKFVSTPIFSKFFAIFAAAVLLVTTLVWSILGVKLQQGNSDQLIYPYLFSHWASFHNATLPSQHSFLIKWPVFLLVKLFGVSPNSLIAFTVILVVLTVAALAAILYKIERRPLVFGTICLALASVLLLVPPQPYPGGLLPVNMAMLTTRNIEYVFYIAGLIILIKSKKFRSWSFWLAVLLLSLVMASDQLFLTISIGGAILALVAYSLANKWEFVAKSVKWLLAGVLGAVGSVIIIYLINFVGLTHITGVTGGGPFGIVHNVKDISIAIVYVIFGVMTIFGANPAYAATVIKNIPKTFFDHLTSIGGFTYVINFLILVTGVYFVYRLIRSSLTPTKSKRKVVLPTSSLLSILLIWTAFAAFIEFVLTNHYYAVDSRYLTITLFAVFVSIATFSRKKNWNPKKLVIISAVIIVGIILGIFSAVNTYKSEQSALSTVNNRDSSVAQILAIHKTTTLLGDYWRVIPTKLDSSGKQNVVPLSGCVSSQVVLSSTNWQIDLTKHSFAYLLTLDKSLTSYPVCSLKQVVNVYGRPNTSVLIDGTLAKPKELLLFYDHGINNKKPKKAQPTAGPDTVVPISLNQLASTTCNVPTIMNIVAHQDDDLLFINPDIQHDIQQGHCVRTVYITSGDAGAGSYYWLGREQGSEAAYSYMLGISDTWVQKVVEINSHEFLSIANPKDNTKVSLIFMRLPDGNLKGQGFPSSNFESLAKLEANQISVFNSVDGQSYYNLNELTAALAQIMQTYQPSEIRTQANYISVQYPDHSDHMAVGREVKKAVSKYEADQFDNLVSIPVRYYIGYPIHAMAANVSGKDLLQKELTFLAYAKYDRGVCQTLQQCTTSTAYSSYLPKEYQNAY